MKTSTDVSQFELGTKVLVRNHKVKYYSDDDWGIIQQSPSNGKIDVKMGDRFHIAVDIADIFLGETPEFQINGVYLHSSGKQATIVKLFKSVPKAEVFFKGESNKQKVNLSDLTFLDQPKPAEQPQLFDLDSFTQYTDQIIGDSAWDDGSAFPEVSLKNESRDFHVGNDRIHPETDSDIFLGEISLTNERGNSQVGSHSKDVEVSLKNRSGDGQVDSHSKDVEVSPKNESGNCQVDSHSKDIEISPKNESGNCQVDSHSKDIEISLKNESSDFQEGDALTINRGSDLDIFLGEISLKNESSDFQVGDRVLSSHPLSDGEILVIEKYPWIDNEGKDFNFAQTSGQKLIHVQYLTKFLGENQCLSTPAYSQVLEGSTSELKQPESLTPSKPDFLSKITPTLNESSSTDSPTSPFTATLETIAQNPENLHSIQLDFPAQAQVQPETEPDSNTQNQNCGSMPCERSQSENLISLLLSNPEELSPMDCEQFLGDSEWSDISGTIRKSFHARSLEVSTSGKDCLLLPTPTTYPVGSGNYRPAGANRLEQKLRPHIVKGDKLHPAVPGWMMGFPPGWVEQVLADTGEMLSVQPPLTLEYTTTSTEDAAVLTSTVEQLLLSKQRSQSSEFVISQNLQEFQETATTPTTSTIKAITLHQPHASLVGIHKFFETRSWSTKYRGKIAIHAAKQQKHNYQQWSLLSDLLPGFEALKFGSVVAIADLTDCILMTEEFIAQQSETELRCGLWEVGRYAWKLENVQILDEPIPARGRQRLWNIDLGLTCAANSGHTATKFLRETQPEVEPPEIPPTPEHPTKFLRETQTEVEPPEIPHTPELPTKFLRETQIETIPEIRKDITPEIPPTSELPTKFLRENTIPPKKIANGSLAPYLENKKLKSGEIITYPRVQGERDKLEYSHWRWGYYHEVKIDGEWKNRSMPVPAKIAPFVREMITKNYSVEEIKGFILQSKKKKRECIMNK
ncbi:hypothetical protein PN464_03190 [Nodularia sphaerocarpa CS-585]|nr:hypothetical protein [Nodularia sphaerocarpa]MDB9372367.1 hypothetical protein [Nodularia sphaerocarpa CS-585]MDB9377983.1 hypothetical protein [Nodularia sphaerocarpa CS-585A2]